MLCTQLASVSDVIDTNRTAQSPYVGSGERRSVARAELLLFDFLPPATQLSCEWLACDGLAALVTGGGTAPRYFGAVNKSALAATFLYAQKKLARIAPAGASVHAAFLAAIDASPLQAATSPTVPPVPTSGAVVAPRGAASEGSECESYAEGALPVAAAGDAQALVASSSAARSFGDGAGGVPGRSYSDGLRCVWTVDAASPAFSSVPERIRIRFTTAKVWTGDVLTVRARTYKGESDVLLARLVGGARARRRAGPTHCGSCGRLLSPSPPPNPPLPPLARMRTRTRRPPGAHAPSHASPLSALAHESLRRARCAGLVVLCAGRTQRRAARSSDGRRSSRRRRRSAATTSS